MFSYFSTRNWTTRLSQFIGGIADRDAQRFAAANLRLIQAQAGTRSPASPLRVVFNLGAGALIDFLATDDYKNIYQRPVVGGRARHPSRKRLDTDQLLGLTPPDDYYFCALATGGCGIAFYGEYCAVLLPGAAQGGIGFILDRNSYDLGSRPLTQIAADHRLSGRQLVGVLSAGFGTAEADALLALKLLLARPSEPRLMTPGQIAAALLSDEDFVEAYHRGKIRLLAIEEMREHPNDAAIESDIRQRWAGGEAVSAEQALWCARRRAIRDALATHGIARRIVAHAGRARRFG